MQTILFSKRERWNEKENRWFGGGTNISSVHWIFLVEYSITQSITMFGNAHILTALFWSFPNIVIDYGIAEAFL